MTRSATLNKILPLLTEPRTTAYLADAIGYMGDMRDLSERLRVWQRAGHISDGPLVERSRADKRGMKFLQTWVLPTHHLAREPGAKTAEVKRVCITPADTSGLLSAALASRSELERCRL